MNDGTVEADGPPPRHRGLRPITWFVLAVLAVGLALANLPGSRVDALEEGGPGCRHGVPWTYLERGTSEGEGPPGLWALADGIEAFRPAALLADLGVAAVVIILAGLAAERLPYRAGLRPRIHVRGLVALVMLIGLALGWFAHQVRRSRIEREAIDALKAVNLHAGLRSDLPDWLREAIGPGNLAFVDHVDRVYHEGGRFGDAELARARGELGRLSRLRVLDLSSTRVGDEGVRRLVGLDGLEVLNLGFTPVTAAGLGHLRLLPNLKALYLGYTEIGAAGVAELAGCRRLETLYLARCRVEAAGVRALADLPRLRRLYLQFNPIGDDDLRYVARLAGLTSLNLKNTDVGDAGLAHLRGLTRMRWVELSRTRVTDAGLSTLAGWGRLETVGLAHTAITDAGLARLASLPGLRELAIDGTPTTDGGLRRLRGGRPEIVVFR